MQEQKRKEFILEGPSDELLEKLTKANPNWSVEDWVNWWGKWHDKERKRQGLPTEAEMKKLIQRATEMKNRRERGTIV